MASDSKNHAERNKRMSLSRRASLMVRHNEAHEYQM